MGNFFKKKQTHSDSECDSESKNKPVEYKQLTDSNIDTSYCCIFYMCPQNAYSYNCPDCCPDCNNCCHDCCIACNNCDCPII
jgi:hypothetical protein